MNPDSYFWPRVIVGAGLVIALALASKVHAREGRRAPAKVALNVEAMIEAIADVESGNNAAVKPGALGELGRCQFLRSTWYDYTNAPFEVFARMDCELTRKVEKAHFARVCAQLIRRGHGLEPALIAAAWRGGVARAASLVRSDAARRTANLYFALPNRPAKPLASGGRGR